MALRRRCRNEDSTSTWTVVGATRTTMHARVPTRQIPATDTDPIVLVHGLGVSSRYMLPTVQEGAGPIKRPQVITPATLSA